MMMTWAGWRVSLCSVMLMGGLIPSLVFGDEATSHRSGGQPSNHDHHDHDHDDHRHAHDSQGQHQHEDNAPSPSSLAAITAFYALLVAGASLFGGWLPGRIQLSHLRFQLLLSVVGGLLLGIGMFHLLVHGIQELGSSQLDLAAFCVMAGVLLTFFLLRAFHVHAHDCPHDHDHDLDRSSRGRLSWAGLFFGLSIHSIMDGVALGAAMQADAAHGGGPFLAFGILLAIALHKPLDSLSIITVMMRANCTPRACRIVNFAYAILCPLATAAFLLGVWKLESGTHQVVGCCLAFSAGAFICIALADLLPEMEFHSHHRWQLSLALMAGIALAWAIRYLEPAHMHHG